MSNKINNIKNAIVKYIENDENMLRIETKNKELISRLKEKINELEKPIKQYKQNKKELLEYITLSLDDAKIKDKVIKLKINDSNYKIRCETIEDKKENITQKYIKDILVKYHKEKNFGKLSEARCIEKAKEEYQFILDSRNTKYTYSLVYDKDL